MYRMFIVDDNQYERMGISQVIDWEGMGIQIAGTFSNGAEALEKVEELQPHIILTDVAMPVMNGIEMSEWLKVNYPNVKIIFMSCYNDFEFAKSAINVGAYGYILKPIITEELLCTVEKLIYEYMAEDAQQQEKEKMMVQMEEMLPLVQEQFLKELLLGNLQSKDDIESRFEFLQMDLSKFSGMHVISLQINHASEQSICESVADSYLISYTIKDIISTINSTWCRIYPVQISQKEYAAILFVKKGSLDADISNEKMMDLAVEINIEIGRRLNLAVSMGISKYSQKPAEIPVLYKQAYSAVNTRFYSGSNPIIRFEEIEDKADISFDEQVNLELVYKDVKALLSYCSDEDILEFINRYYKVGTSKPAESYIKALTFSIINTTSIILMESGQSFSDIFGDEILIWKKLIRFETILDIQQWVFNLFKSIRDYLSEKNSSKNSKLVEIVKDIVRERYHDQITVEDISKAIYLSAGYANNLFKKETGQTIFDYLLEFRIDMAKKLLKDPESKVAVVSEKVGYTNKSYFCLAFKKQVGMTPAEYKNKAML